MMVWWRQLWRFLQIKSLLVDSIGLVAIDLVVKLVYKITD